MQDLGIVVGAAIGAMVTWLALRGTFARRMAEGHASARAAAAAADARLQEADRRASDIASRLARAERELESTRARAEASTADCARLMAEVAAAAEKQALLETAEIKLREAFKTLASEALEQNAESTGSNACQVHAGQHLQKVAAIDVVEEDLLARVAAGHDVVDCTGNMDAERAHHAAAWMASRAPSASGGLGARIVE